MSNPGKFKKGEVRPGQGKHGSHKTTKVLKEAILLAAAAVGEDGNGKGELQGYLQRLANKEPKAFASLLGKVLPLTLTSDPDDPLRIVGRIELVPLSGNSASTAS